MTRLTLLIFFCAEASAQVLPAGPRAAAMAGAGVAVADASFADSNPASFSGTRVLSVRAAQLYGLPELRFGEAFVTLPALRGGVAFSIAGFGFDDYREMLLSLGYSRSIRAGTARPLLAGIRLHWFSLSIDGYGSASTPSLSAGLILPVDERLTLGMAASNLYAPPRSAAGVLDRSVTVGATIRPAGSLLVVVEAWKAATSPADLRFGLEVRPLEVVALRAGFTLEPRRYAAGAGLHLAPIFADLAAQYHDALGWSPSVAAGVSW